MRPFTSGLVVAAGSGVCPNIHRLTTQTSRQMPANLRRAIK
jgi:hypothetical protein